MKSCAGNALGIYVSIPFCRSKCTYCNFASGVFPASDHARYVERVIADLAGARAWAGRMGAELPRRVDTVYLGGGTPSLLAPELIDATVRGACARSSISMRMPRSPWSARRDNSRTQRSDAMTAAGVNRVSLGVQSFVDSEAHGSGRLHSRAVVEEDLRRLRAAGIANLSVDLIAGLAGQTFASWEESLDALIATRGSSRQRVHAGGGRGLAAGARSVERRSPLSRRTGAERRRDCAHVRAGDRAVGCGGTPAVRDFELLPSRTGIAA